MLAEEKLLTFLHALGLSRKRPAGAQGRVEADENIACHRLYQVSTLNAIMEGAFDGALTISELRQHGNFGLGTFNALDGELVFIDGEVFKARPDGTVRRVDDAEQTPFAVVQYFVPEWRQAIDGRFNFEDLPGLLARYLPSTNYFYAVRIDGFFEHVHARSVARQQKPYPPLVEVVKRQSVFNFSDLPGSIVGFRFPDYAAGMNMPGWHLHFISDDRQAGGHVMDFCVTGGTLAVEHTSEFFMELPENEGFAGADLAKDQSEAIEFAERARE